MTEKAWPLDGNRLLLTHVLTGCRRQLKPLGALLRTDTRWFMQPWLMGISVEAGSTMQGSGALLAGLLLRMLLSLGALLHPERWLRSYWSIAPRQPSLAMSLYSLGALLTMSTGEGGVLAWTERTTWLLTPIDARYFPLGALRYRVLKTRMHSLGALLYLMTMAGILGTGATLSLLGRLTGVLGEAEVT